MSAFRKELTLALASGLTAVHDIDPEQDIVSTLRLCQCSTHALLSPRTSLLDSDNCDSFCDSVGDSKL